MRKNGRRNNRQSTVERKGKVQRRKRNKGIKEEGMFLMKCRIGNKGKKGKEEKRDSK